VAREAGVSRATVSYVLNDTANQRIPDSTRQRVWEAVRRLGYAPSAAARSLRSGRSEVVLLLLPDWPIGRMVGTLLEEMALAFARAGLILVAHPRAGNDRPVAEIWNSLSPAAVIGWEALESADEAAMQAAGVEVNVVLLGSAGSGSRGLAVSEQRTGRIQVEHLAARGHRNIGYAFPDDARVLTFAQPRLEGVRDACAELSLDAPDVQTVPVDIAGAAEAVRHWRAQVQPVTAVCAYNDEVALAVLAGLRAEALRAPGDLAVIGVDDLPLSSVADPPLTSVATRAKSLAAYVVETVLAGLRGDPGPPAPSSDILRLVVREST
jgi:DNA-binding LacI/PurR family transcriptional regulator